MFWLRSFFAVLVLGTIAFAQSPYNVRRVEDIYQTKSDELISYRLPNNTRPASYDISLWTNVHNGDFNFTGTVKIVIDILAPTSVITLHQRQLTIIDVKLFTHGVSPIPMSVGPIQYDVVTEFLTIPIANTLVLPAGAKMILEIKYSGILRSDNAGFYRSSYVAEDQSVRWLATTQFESTDARHGFPCFDETWLRANFTIRITHDATYNAISNMPVDGPLKTNPDGSVTTTFQTTPSTPTYLIAFIVSDFEFKSNVNSTGLPHRVYSRPNAINTTDFSLAAGETILASFDDYFQIQFSLPKMDQIAIPDFAAGAMENWGLVTYREEGLLWDNDVNTFSTKRYIISIIAHEFAHQWFGNLVTPKWWTYIWLNEGFATLYAAYASDWIHPEWKVLDAFVVQNLQGVLRSDALDSTRPMTQYAESPQDISNLFDNIAYDKSGCVLRMMLHAITEKTFQKGLINYLNANAYEDAIEDDLFNALNLAAREDLTLPNGLSVTTIMRSWAHQKGYPVLIVNRDYATGNINLDQQRYQSVVSTTNDTARWWIPLNFVTSEDNDFTKTFASDWFSPSETSRVVTPYPSRNWTNNDFVIFNAQQTGYYRVQYDERNYELITKSLIANSSSIHLVNRAQLIDDAFVFASTSRISYDIALKLASTLEHDLEFAPWTAGNYALSQLNRLLAGSDNYKEFQKFVKKISAHLFSSRGIEDSDIEDLYNKQSRIFATNWACIGESKQCSKATQEAIEAFTNGSKLHQNVEAVVLCNALRNGTTAQYEFVLSKFQASTSSEERQRLSYALTCTRNRDLLQSLLQLTISTNNTIFRSAIERTRVFLGVVQNSAIGTSFGIKFLMDNLEESIVSFANNFNTVLTTTATYTVTLTHRSLFNTFSLFLKVTKGINQLVVERALAIVEENEKWQTVHQKTVETWLIKYNGSASLVVSMTLIAVTVIASLRNIF